MTEFFCPYCKLWINDTIHVQHHHNEGEHGERDEITDDRVKINGVIYENEEEWKRSALSTFLQYLDLGRKDE